jgi:hypothetical protein
MTTYRPIKRTLRPVDTATLVVEVLNNYHLASGADKTRGTRIAASVAARRIAHFILFVESPHRADGSHEADSGLRAPSW